ncbi:hypothetical protein [Sulfurospirillum sp. MES]|uniref:hypothetical protein n=1 Tax=Sulfurospirillum sp. MES TaxID=1565314 RepID=UPI000543FB1F|nr:hypothetical protein [Sulfurospirillum sp. MES]KHG33257.1 MAG: hypothetical protein OA34_10455 [Sulfurospirillum sp. MES]
MIKEIVDIGRVSNKLGSVFTFKDLPKFYVEIILEWDGKDFTFIPNETIQYTNDIEKYLEYGVHRGKKGSTLYFFPTSFIVTKKELTTDKAKLLKKFQDGQKEIIAFIKDEKYREKKVFLEKKSSCLIDNLNSILELASVGLDRANQDKEKNERKDESIAIVVKVKSDIKIDNDTIFEIFQSIEFYNTANILEQGAGKTKAHTMGNCNVTQQNDLLYYPSGSFYYPFSTDKINVKYNLTDAKNIFVLSKEAYINFMTGTTFLESNNRFYFMGLNSYITASCLNDEVLKEFQKYTKEAQSNFDGLLNLVSKFFQNRNELLLNFYFNEPTKTGNNIVEYIKDVIPSTLIRNVKLFKEYKEFYAQEFNRKLDKYSWQQHIYHIFYKDGYRKMRTALFRKIALNDKIDAPQVMLFLNEKMQYGISKKEDDKQRYYSGDVVKHYIFLCWISKINKGESTMNEQEKQEAFVGKSYEEKLTYFLQNCNLVKDSSSMKIGACIGLAIKILSWSINNYDKKALAFVGKRIERNNLNSVQIFMNEIFAKTKFHEFEGLQSINIKLSTQELLKLDDKRFNKDEFIFGLFLGNELYNNVKSDKDPTPPTNEEEITEDDTTTGEENE